MIYSQCLCPGVFFSAEGVLAGSLGQSDKPCPYEMPTGHFLCPLLLTTRFNVSALWEEVAKACFNKSNQDGASTYQTILFPHLPQTDLSPSPTGRKGVEMFTVKPDYEVSARKHPINHKPNELHLS